MAYINNFGGKVQVADDVIATIAGTSALEVDGVFGAGRTISGDIAGVLGVKNPSKGVKLDIKDDEATIELNLIVKSGHLIQAVSEAAQKRVKTAVETMTGLRVSAVNINVSGVVQPKERKLKRQPPKRTKRPASHVTPRKRIRVR